MTKENLGELKKKAQHYDQGFEYAYGPLNKSNETRLFEQIVEDIITDRQNVLNGSVVSSEPKVKTTVQDGTMCVIRNGEEININKLLENVNLNHVRLSEKALHGYEVLYENDPKLQGSVPSRAEFDQRLSKSDIHQQASLSQLSYAEKVGINVYTSNEYTSMNGMLRGYKSPKDFDKHLMDIAVSSQGLNSLPSIELPTVSRMQGDYGLEKMIAMQENHEVEQIQGFTSTAYKTQKQFGNVQIVYENVHGVNVAALSEFPHEKEYLIPPSTQIKYTGHKIIEGRHVFTAEGANILLDTKQEISSTKRVEGAVNSLIEQAEKQIEDKGRISTKEAESFLKEVIDLSVRHGVINKTEQELYFKKDKSGKSVFEKEVKSLTESPKELSLRDKLLNGVSSIFESVGFKKLANIFKKKISVKGQEVIRQQPKQNLQTAVKSIREKLANHIEIEKTSSGLSPATHLKSKSSGGISK